MLGMVAGGCSKERSSVTTCTRCGQPIYPGASTCPTCGAYLVPTAQAGQPNGAAPFGGGQWQAPVSPYPGGQPNGGNGSFSASSLVSNDALPDWLVQASSGALGPTPGGSGGLRANGAGGYGGAQPQEYGQSGWYGGAGQAPGSGGYGQMPASGGYGQAPGSGVLGQPPVAPSYGSSSRELFDESALPDWLRQPSSGGGADMAQQPTAYQPAAAPNGGYGGGPARYAAPANPAPSYGGPQYADPRYASAQYGASQQHSSQYSAMPPGPAYSPSGYAGYPATPPQQGGRSGALGQMPFAGPSPAGAFPSIESAGASPMNRAGGMPAHALVDSGALPGWLAGQPNQPPAVSGGLANGDGMSAHSLIDEAALPQWLRAQPAVAAPARAMPHPPVSPAAPVAPWSAPATADEPLPTWLNQVYVEANVPRVEPARIPSGWLAPQPPTPSPSDRYAGASGGGLSASAFVDETALPEWLKSQGGVPAQGSAHPSQVLAGSYAAAASANESRDFGAYAPQGAQAAQAARPEEDSPARFSVSDLIDPEALPSWVSGQSPAANPAWTSNQPATRAAGSSTLRPGSGQELPTGAATDGGGWDEPNVPGWMRTLGEEGGGQPSASYQSVPSPRGQSDDLGRGSHMDPSASATWRRGQPIPSAELPPWLRAPNAARDGAAPRGADYGYQQRGRDPMDGADGWPDDARQEAQWTDWDEGGYDADYDAEAEYQDDRDRRREKQRGGWRRLFGRG